MKRRITITQEDIDLGIPRTSYACAVVMALRREYPLLEPAVVPFMEGVEVRHRVHLFDIETHHIEEFHVLKQTFLLSKNATKAIVNYDHKEVMSPATFEMTEIER
jgi:hypothetical protein